MGITSKYQCVRAATPGMVGLALWLVLLLLPVATPGTPASPLAGKAQAACPALPTGNGTATFTVSVPSSTVYRFWAHMYSPSSGNNAVYLQIDDSYCQITVGNASVAAGQFTWVDYQNGNTSSKINATLTSGNHTVKLAGLDPGVGVDKVMLLADTACTPAGDGGNCVAAATPTPGSGGGGATPAPTVVVTPSAGGTTTAAGTTVSGVISLPKAPAGTKRTYYLDGKPVDGTKLDTAKLSDGTHTLKIVDTDASGRVTTTSQKLLVQNRKSWPARVLGWIKQPVNAAIALVAVLALAAGGWAAWRFGLVGKIRARFLRGPGLSSATATTPAHSTPASDGPPPSRIIYPDRKGPDAP